MKAFVNLLQVETGKVFWLESKELSEKCRIFYKGELGYLAIQMA
jgi:hypothetical protein